MKQKYFLAIDPGTEKSGWVLFDENLKPQSFGKDDNELLKKMFDEIEIEAAVIERVSAYGTKVGQSVFTTCEWIGRFTEALTVPVYHMRRKDVKTRLGLSQRAADGDVRKYLIRRFARSNENYGKGNRKNPDWFYGFSADVWQAYALGVAWADCMRVEHAG